MRWMEMFCSGSQLLRVCLLLASALGLSVSPAATLNSIYAHTNWTWRVGLKALPIQALAQTDNGYLWLGTRSGLWRFDGAHFVKWKATADTVQLPSEDVRSLSASKDGTLWIGTTAGISKLESGSRLSNYWTPGNSREIGIRSLLYEPARGLLMGANTLGNGLTVFRQPGMPVRAGAGLADSEVNAIYRDHDGVLWIGTRRGLCRWHPNKVDCFLTDPPTEIYSITEDVVRKRLVIACDRAPQLRYFENGQFRPLEMPQRDQALEPRVVLADRRGDIWVGMFSQGLAQIHEGQVSRFASREGLSGSSVQALLEDHDGNIWVGTRTGLDRLRSSGITQLTQDDGLPDDLISALAASRDGGLYIGSATAGLRYVRGGKVTNTRAQTTAGNDSILSLYEDSAGRLWIGTRRGLLVQTSRDAPAAPVHTQLDRVTALTGDRRGRIWIADSSKGVHVLSGNAAQPLKVPGLPPEADVYALMADRRDRLWVGYYHGELAVIDEGAVTTYAAGKDLASGPVVAIHEDDEGIVWVASGGGLSRFQNGQWTVSSMPAGIAPAMPFQLLSDHEGGLWVATGSSLFRFAKSDLTRQTEETRRRLPFISYDFSQGILPQAALIRAQPRACKSADGRLWFARDAGVVIVDPSLIKTAEITSSIAIDQIKVDGRPVFFDQGTPDTLAFHGRELQIGYTAISISGYSDAQFSYQLQGFDPQQVDIGTSHEARYTNIPPGRYTFRVTGSVQGLWTETTPPVSVVVLPSFHQTVIFRAACGLAVTLVFLAVYKLRLSQISRKYKLLSQVRLAERTRIATDLHDTLLQSVVGASLQLETIANHMRQATVSEPFEGSLWRVRRQLDDALCDARNAVAALSAPILNESNLSDAIRHVGNTLIGGRIITFDVNVRGAPFRYPIETEEQLLRIGQEAIANAVNHSRGNRICVEFIYSAQDLVMRVSDNGGGFDPGLIETGRQGHVGLLGMRQRAKQISATLVISTSPTGTVVSIHSQRPRAAGDPFRALVCAVRKLFWASHP
jgi:ligand-binding sensor domain-containing protein/signal transduction histidine kinase